MLSRLVAVLILCAVGVWFLVSSEEGGGASLLGWLRDPLGSRLEHVTLVERDRERTALEPVGAPEQPPLLDGSSASAGETPAPAPLAPDAEGAALALAGAEVEDDLESLLEASRVTLRGLALAPDGRPLEGVRVAARQPGGSQPETHSGADGSFELSLRGAGGALEIDDQAWVLLGGELGLGPGQNVGGEARVLVLAPRADLSGRALDERGRPLSGVLVRAEADLTSAAPSVDRLLPATFELRARSDAEGAWSLAPLPDLPGLRLRFAAEGRPALDRQAAELRASADVTLPALQDG